MSAASSSSSATANEPGRGPSRGQVAADGERGGGGDGGEQRVVDDRGEPGHHRAERAAHPGHPGQQRVAVADPDDPVAVGEVIDRTADRHHRAVQAGQLDRRGQCRLRRVHRFDALAAGCRRSAPSPRRRCRATRSAIPTAACGRSRCASRGRRPRPGPAPTACRPSFAEVTASSIAATVSAYGVPRLTSTPPAIAANGPASSGLSTMAGAAPTASSTLAVHWATTMFVRHCTSGTRSRSAARASAQSWAVTAVAGAMALESLSRARRVPGGSPSELPPDRGVPAYRGRNCPDPMAVGGAPAQTSEGIFAGPRCSS